MQSPIALVGNGPLRKEWGTLIDSHPTVIRMNHFRITGFEALCGRKLTHWATAANLTHKPESFLSLRRVIRVIRRGWGSPDWENREVWLPDMGNQIPALVPRPYDADRALRLRTHFGREGIFLYDRRLYLPILELSPYPTTGFSMACLLVTLQKKISAFGFNSLQGGHYWNASDKPPRLHLATARIEFELISTCSLIDVYE